MRQRWHAHCPWVQAATASPSRQTLRHASSQGSLQAGEEHVGNRKHLKKQTAQEHKHILPTVQAGRHCAVHGSKQDGTVHPMGQSRTPLSTPNRSKQLLRPALQTTCPCFAAWRVSSERSA